MDNDVQNRSYTKSMILPHHDWLLDVQDQKMEKLPYMMAMISMYQHKFQAHCSLDETPKGLFLMRLVQN